jgi:hypothetical protein
MEVWDQPLEQRIAAAQQRLLVERCLRLHHGFAGKPAA